MRKITKCFVVVLIIALAFSLVGCGNGNRNEDVLKRTQTATVLNVFYNSDGEISAIEYKDNFYNEWRTKTVIEDDFRTNGNAIKKGDTIIFEYHIVYSYGEKSTYYIVTGVNSK